MNRFLAYICLALSMSMVGSYVALSKPLSAAFPVFLLAWLRFGIGGLAMLSWIRRPADEAPMTRQTKQLLFLESFIGNFLFSICMLLGVSMTSATAAGVIMASIPAAVALMSWLFLGERISPRIGLAVFCAVIGISLLPLTSQSPTGGQISEQPWTGYFLLLGAVLCEATYAVIGKKLTAELNPKRISALINLWGFVMMTPLGYWVARDFNFSSITISTWGLLTFYGLAASVWTVWLWMTGLKLIPASQAGVFTVFLPISATLVGVLALNESLGRVQILALGLALAGVLLATLPQKSPAKNIQTTD